MVNKKTDTQTKKKILWEKRNRVEKFEKKKIIDQKKIKKLRKADTTKI